MVATLAAPGAISTISIIFIHGLRGHPRETWSHVRLTPEPDRNEDSGVERNKRKSFKVILGLKKGKERVNNGGPSSLCTESTGTTSVSTTPSDIFWPEEYLAQDLPQARIWTYGYNADVIGVLYKANNQSSVSQHGRDLCIALERDLNNEDPIVFVVHSLGGIITKDALHRSEVTRKRTRLVVFLGTPHRGSAYAGWGEIAANLARLGLQDSNKRLVQTLEVNGEVLDNIHEEFKTILTQYNIKVHSFQEAKGITGMKGIDNKVVDNFSSKLDLSREQETVETIDANHMQMAKCGSREDERYRKISGVLRQFIKRDLQEVRLQPAEAGNETRHTSLFMVPFSRDENFVGREDILCKLKSKGQERAPGKHRREALIGLGGVGKSQIAIEHAYRIREQDPQMMVFWVHASTKARFVQAYQEIADKLALPGRDNAKVNVLQLVRDWLSDEANGRWLIILDNVDDDSVFFDSENSLGVDNCEMSAQQAPLEKFLPQVQHGSVLITSRNKIAAGNLIGMFGNPFPVEPMEEADSIKLLKTQVPSADSSDAELKELAEVLEGIPLAITHAAAYIRSRPRVTVSIYLSLFRENDSNRARLLSNDDIKDLRRDHSTRHAVVKTWQISMDQIQQTNAQAADLLALMSMFDRQGIPGWLLHDGKDRLQFEDALSPLLSYSLVREQSGGETFEMHRLVKISTRKWIELHGDLLRWRSEAVKIMARLFPNGDYETWHACQALLPHAVEVLSYEGAAQDDILNLASIKHNLGWYLMSRGEYIRAETELLEAVEKREAELGVSHPDTLTSLSKLASVLQRQGRYAEAESMNRRALEGREKELGVSHPDTLASLSKLASVLQRQGRYAEAETMNRRALEGYEKELGVSHPDTLTSLSKLASVLQRQGRYAEAESMNRRALEGREKELGVSHPDTLTSLSNLALVLQQQGRYAEAETMNRRALEGYEKELGVSHPDTLTSVYHLAFLLTAGENHGPAVELYQRACDGYDKVLGPSHPTTIACRRHFDSLLDRIS